MSSLIGTRAADLAETERSFLAGDYAKAEEVARAEVDAGIWNENWSRLLIRSLMTQGKYAEALAVYEKAIGRYTSSLHLRLLGRDVLRMNNMNDRAKEEAAMIVHTIQRSPTRYLSRDNMVAAGRYFADRGEDARKILELFYDQVRKVDPKFVEAYIATAELAILKGDFAVASETLANAAKLAPQDPQIVYLSAVAWQSSDGRRADKELARALALNPQHVPSLLMQVDSSIDREDYKRARAIIDQVFSINPVQWEANAYLAVLAHLEGDFAEEEKKRLTALAVWEQNPGVDHLIGRKLSDKYLFEQGAEYQRRAITLDPNYHPASFQLAQDLLRLGYDDVGWELAEKVSTDDPYNVVAHNLVTLHESLRQFSMLTREDIHLRMDPREASIYGDEALQVLTDAKRVLSEKYQVELAEPVFVEIFPAQKDFAIRTFGLPGGDGYLGVCFGNVVTANSPASQGVRPYNWQSVLWHEFCHVITLNKTKNRMPRWLSEGISVYEERQRNPAWGEQMIPSYRTMILGKDLTPVSQLSSAFLRPPSPLHLQFAYFESSLVVEYLIERYGIDLIRQVLESLGDGMSINTSIEQTVGALDRLDVEFAEFARRRAQAFGFGADWESKAPSKASVDELLGWSKLHPTSYQILMQLADAQMRAEDYPAAKRTLERLVKLNIVSGERNGVLEKMAIVAGQLPLPKAEERAIHEWLAYSSDALPGLERLLELARKRNDWDEVARLGKEIIAIHPLKPVGHQAIVDAGEALDKPQWISRGIAAQMELDPVDMAGMQYRLAKSLALQGELEQAKRHVLRALAEAPRYRDAHQLLYQLTHKEPQ